MQSNLLEAERKVLIRKIENVFANVKVPKKIGDAPEVQDFVGKERKALTVEMIKSHHDFWLMTDEAFKYFLPGYFILMLSQPEQVKDIDLILALLRHLGQAYDNRPAHDLCPLFDKYQKAVIVAFLDMVETLWFPEWDIEVKVAKAKPARRVQARREVLAERAGWMTLLNKTRFNWGICQSTLS